MMTCCVSACKNQYDRHALNKKVKFYRIPTGNRPFQTNRRRLWLQAIQEANGSAAGLRGNAHVCSAHFISGEASTEFDSPDFVPSVFTCPKQNRKQNQKPKKKVKWYYGRRKKHWRKTRIGTEENAALLRGDSSVDLQPSVTAGGEDEDELSAAPSVPKEEETMEEASETETETKIIKLQTSPQLKKTPPPLTVLPDILKLDKKRPIVLLKPVIAPAGGYQCEVCSQTFSDASQLVKHKRLHEEQRSFVCEICGKSFTSEADFTEHHATHRDEPSFPCNMCDRSFTTSHHLKRHKLLHVKDGRKCLRCGALFCQRHNHVLFLPRTESKTESEPEDDSSVVGTENDPSNELEPSQMSDITVKTESSQTITPPPSSALSAAPAHSDSGFISKSSPLASPTTRAETPPPVFLKPCPVPRPFTPKVRRSRNPGTSFHRDYLAQNAELPSSLKMFSPRYLTSALLEVHRNYEYILSKPRNSKARNVVKKEEDEPEMTSSEGRCTNPVKEERIASDLDIVV